MNQGVSQALSMLLYAIAAVSIFTVAIALFGGGYYQYTEGAGTTKTHTAFNLNKDDMTVKEKETAVKVNSLWEQIGTTMTR